MMMAINEPQTIRRTFNNFSRLFFQKLFDRRGTFGQKRPELLFSPQDLSLTDHRLGGMQPKDIALGPFFRCKNARAY